ncbi:MAG: glycosyltransferase, partial [Candidatus Latescibacteria bacterium]|nr:glycosyltransferase [bacterium]MBD3422955.1 glycosyltransferase [Candidatus Latescibacterota bacterium]
LEDQIASSGAKGRIFLHGRVDHGEMVRWYNSCDILCLPSLAEGTPNVILEALACSVPVVASSTGGIPDIVDAESGLLFPPGELSPLARAIGEALDRKWDRDRIKCPSGSWQENASELSGIFASLSRID